MYRKIVVMALLLSALSTVAAQDSVKVAELFKEKLAAVSSSNKTIQALFTQTQKVKNIKEPVVRKGNFYYDNKGLMAMHYTQPQDDKIIMCEEAFLLTTAGKTKRVESAANPMLAQLSFMMQACMSGDVSKLGRGWQMQVEQVETEFKVVLMPTDRRISRYLTAITLWFDGNDFTLNKLRMDEKAGGYTHYSFTKKQLNVPIAASLFNVEL
ncbi:MAG: LolA family protein [Phocaeicola sp.]